MAGKTLKCPKCQQPLPIPARAAPAAPASAPAPQSNQLASLFEEAGFKEHRGPRCPQCGKPLTNPTAILCTHCGFHLQTGQKFEGAKVYKEGERGHAEAADNLLARAEKQIETDKVEAKKNVKSGMPAWVLFLALAGIVAFVTGMFMIPRDQAFEISGYCLVGFGSLMSFYYGVRMIIVAFQESTTCGILYILLPVYPLYYLITRWDKMGGLFLMNLIYNVVIGAGVGMVVAAPMLRKDKEQQEVRLMPAEEIRAATPLWM